MRPKLTIVTASFNRPEMLRECAQSIFNQTCSDWEWVLVLDGAEPSYGKVIDWLNDLPRSIGERCCIVVRDTTTERRRAIYQPAVITNEQFSATRGERVVWLSDDDLLLPWFVEVMTGLKCAQCEGSGDRHPSGQVEECPACLGTGIPPAIYCSVERRAKVKNGWQTTNINWAVEPWQYGISDGGAMVLSKRAWDELGWREPTGWDTAPDLDQQLMNVVNAKHPLRAVRDVLLIHRDTRTAAHQGWRRNLWQQIDRMEEQG